MDIQGTALIDVKLFWLDMLQAYNDDERTKRPKRKFIDSKFKELRPLLKLLAKYSTNPPGSLVEPSEGMKYRMPR
jgi:hypothetical protein